MTMTKKRGADLDETFPIGSMYIHVWYIIFTYMYYRNQPNAGSHTHTHIYIYIHTVYTQIYMLHICKQTWLLMGSEQNTTISCLPEKSHPCLISLTSLGLSHENVPVPFERESWGSILTDDWKSTTCFLLQPRPSSKMMPRERPAKKLVFWMLLGFLCI